MPIIRNSSQPFGYRSVQLDTARWEWRNEYYRKSAHRWVDAGWVWVNPTARAHGFKTLRPDGPPPPMPDDYVPIAKRNLKTCPVHFTELHRSGKCNQCEEV